MMSNSVVGEMVEPAPSRTPLLGTRADLAGAARASVGAVLACAVYVAAASMVATAPSALEVVATATSLACVWLTRRQNIWSMPIGIVSCVAMGIVFFDIGLVGQGWLQVAFYIPIQVVGWRLWLRAGADGGELPATWLRPAARVTVAAAVVAATFVLAAVFHRVHGDTPFQLWDASIVAASIAAQLLLTVKKVESWWLWMLPVDVSAVFLYLAGGAPMFAALYALYVVIAASGWVEWHRAALRHDAGESAVAARTAVGAATGAR
jgi:nicotinamide mononucleotide transporter